MKIATLWQSKTSISEIARELLRNKSTISRELKRNKSQYAGEYWPDSANSKALNRRKRGSKIDRNDSLKAFIIQQLTYHYWTPEQISGFLKCRQKAIRYVSHESIYKWIYSGSFSNEKLWNFLPRHKKKRGLRKSKSSGISRIPGRVSIHKRPKSIGKEFGHLEGDLVTFKRNTQQILVLRERKTMFTFSCVLPSKHAETTAESIIALLKDIPKEARKTLTLDNGTEFTNHLTVAEKLGLDTYFCDPYASWQKGGVENTNGRLRRDLPRKMDVKKMRKEDFDETIENYNTTPRKGLNWLTPSEAFRKNLQRVALQT